MKNKKIVVIEKSVIPKDAQITLRMNKEIKTSLQQLAEEKNMKLSKFLQNLAMTELERNGFYISVNHINV